jgi:hypothetical protein
MIVGHPLSHGPKSARPSAIAAAKRCRRKFLSYFPGGFRDPSYLDLERGYKEAAHEKWMESLHPAACRALLKKGRYAEIAEQAVRIESRTNLLFSFEKMAVRDAIKSTAGARLFAEGLYDFLHGPGGDAKRFERWIETLGKLPRRQTRVLTWPVATVWGFIAQPERHLFLKPTVTRVAAGRYGFPFEYRSRPDWETYSNALDFAGTVRKDNKDLKPRDMIDSQGFIWVQGSGEYPD